MALSSIESLKIKAKLLQKAKKKAGKPLLLKEAFELLAKKAGFSSWREMKENLEANQDLCPPGTSAHWKTWYTSYEEAKEHWKKTGGFLISYQKHFFVCDADYIKILGIISTDSDLEKVGTNWVEPLNFEAWFRLLKKIKSHSTASSRRKAK